MTTVLTALALGAFAGLIPGPYTTMVVGTAMERGFRPAARLALAPFVTETPPMILTALVLEALNREALTWIGVIGGAIVVFVGVRFIREHSGKDDDEALGDRQSARFWHVATSTLLSPSPWLFWLVVAAPLMLRAWTRHPFEGVVFVAILYGTNIGSATLLAWLASHGARLMNNRWRRRALRFTGGVLAVVGLVLIWQSAAGNFQKLVERNQEVRERIENGGGSPAQPSGGTRL